MYKKYILFLRIFYGFIYGFFIIYIPFSETHIDYFCPVIHGIAYTICHIFIPFVPIRNYPYTHNLYVICDTVNAFSVVPFSTDDTRHMCAMISVRAFNIRISIKTLSCIFIVVANNMSGIIRFIQMIIYLCPVVVDPFLQLFVKIFNALVVVEFSFRHANSQFLAVCLRFEGIDIGFGHIFDIFAYAVVKIIYFFL